MISMDSDTTERNEAQVSLCPVSRDNWRDVAGLKVSETQREFVAEPAYYLALCCYGNDWHPLAICLDDQVIGFMMWALDPADNSCWLGGIFVDQSYQKRGYGRQAIQAAIAMLAEEHGYQHFALSYSPDNGVKHLYHSLGFVETNEWEGDEVVARLSHLPGSWELPGR
jgi:diamine N-acetyltransferase